MLRHRPGQTADVYFRTTEPRSAASYLREMRRRGAAHVAKLPALLRKSDARLPHPSHKRNGVEGDLVRAGPAIKASHGAWPGGPRPLLCHNEANTKGLPAL